MTLLHTHIAGDELANDPNDIGGTEPGLADDLLDEIGDDKLDESEEGFGHIPEPDEEDEEEDEASAEEEEEDLEAEEDVEDVDYDTFDDIDDM